MQGTLTFAPSSMTGYRARLTPADAPPLTWHIPDCAPLLKVGRASFVFPRAIKEHIFYIVSLPSACTRILPAPICQPLRAFPLLTTRAHMHMLPSLHGGRIPRTPHTPHSPTALTQRQLTRLELALDDFCSIFRAKEEDLTADEWAQQLQVLANSAQYNSRVRVVLVGRGWLLLGVT